MGSSKPATSTTIQQENHDPWAPATPYLGELLTESQRLYSQGQGSQVYGGERYAGLGDTTQAGIQSLVDNSAPSAATTNGQDFAASTLGSNGLTPETMAALGGLGSIGTANLGGLRRSVGQLTNPFSAPMQTANGLASGAYDTDTGNDYRSLIAGNAGQSATATNLAGVARGDYLDPSKGNPYLDDLINQSATDAGNQVAAKFSASGRYGSGSFSRAVADATDRIATQTRAQEYDSERQRQADANTAIDSAENARKGLTGSLLGSLTSQEQGNVAQRLQGANLAAQQEAAGVAGQQSLVSADQANRAAQTGRATSALQATQNGSTLASNLLAQLPQLEQLRQAPAQQLLTAGALQDADRQSRDDAAQQVFQENADAPYRSLGLLQSVAQPVGGMGGSSTGVSVSRTQAAQSSPFQQVLGGGLGLLGALGKVGLFGSDERVKSDIEKVGELPSGIDLVTYDLDPALGGGRQLGVVAQDVEQKRPDAVVEMPGGLKMVDYAKATADEDGNPLLTGPVGLLGRKGNASAGNDNAQRPAAPPLRRAGRHR